MCMDSEWMKWANAWQTKGEYSAETLGISYMLSGDEGASNIDPYAEGPTNDNEWIEEGAHLMIVAPAALLDGYPNRPGEWRSVHHVEGHALSTPDGADRLTDKPRCIYRSSHKRPAPSQSNYRGPSFRCA